MRRGRAIGGAATLVAIFTALALTPAALAGGTPMDICKDLQDGTLNGTYTVAQLQAFFSDPTVQGYCGPIATSGSVKQGPTAPPQATVSTSGVKGAAKTVRASAPTQAVLGASHTAAPRASSAAPLAVTKTQGTLPFTGAQLALFAVVGLALLGTGLLLRTTARRDGHA